MAYSVRYFRSIVLPWYWLLFFSWTSAARYRFIAIWLHFFVIFIFFFVVRKVNTTAEYWALLTLPNANLCCVFHSDITTFTLNYNDINEREDHNSNSHNDTETKKNRLNRSSKTGFFSVVLSSVVWFLAILSMCRDSKSDYFSTFTYISVRIYIGYLFALMMCSAKFMHTKSLDNVGHVKRTRIGAHRTHTRFIYIEYRKINKNMKINNVVVVVVADARRKWAYGNIL